MLVRLTCVPGRPDEMLPLANAVEEAGLDGLGVAHSPHLHGATYPVVQHVLANTSRIRVGPFVANPVTQHPSVHAADVDALDALFPGRVFFGVGTGDSAVSSVGLKPAKPEDLAKCVDVVYRRVGERVPTVVAIGGPRAAGAVPTTADGVVLGGGLDVGWSSSLVESAERSAGHRLRRWGFLVGSLGPADDVDRRRYEVLGSVTTVARHALKGDMRRKGVPEHLVAGLQDVFARYDVTMHGRLEGAHHEALSRYPEHCRYLLERFAVVDADQATSSRLRQYADALGLEGLYLSATVPDQVAHAHHVGKRLVPPLTRS